MKLLVVFVSALVLVSANVVPEGDVETVYTLDVQPDGPEGQGYAVGDGAPQEVRVFNAPEAEPSPDLLDAEIGLLGSDNFYIPILTRACTNSACAYICGLLGFKHGHCISTTTCNCYN